MGKSFSTVLLAIGAFVMVGIGAFVIVTVALSDDESEAAGSPASAETGEQHVYLTNLGMTWRSCAGAVAFELDSIDGILEHETYFEGDYVELRYDAEQVSIDEIMDQLEDIGYRPAAYRAVPDESK